MCSRSQETTFPQANGNEDAFFEPWCCTVELQAQYG
jgi:hypothetical protein